MFIQCYRDGEAVWRIEGYGTDVIVHRTEVSSGLHQATICSYHSYTVEEVRKKLALVQYEESWVKAIDSIFQFTLPKLPFFRYADNPETFFAITMLDASKSSLGAYVARFEYGWRGVEHITLRPEDHLLESGPEDLGMIAEFNLQFR
jgi:hypothetical protein